MQRVEVLGLPVDLVSLEQAVARIGEMLESPGTHQVITLNPEYVVRAQGDPELVQAARESELVTADGVGIVWAVRQLSKQQLPERVSGADLVPALLERFGPKLRVFFLGARPGVAQKAAEKARARWGIQVVGVQDGYFKDEAPIVERIAQARPDLLLVGMGERQDLFIYRNKARLGARVAIGIGGMLDVLSGEVKRVHPLFQRLGLEWLVRIAGDRKRWGRFPRLIQFVRLVQAAKKAHSR
ncbi:WecB/TagA/CpsF family glycosyltransferase [Calidithermus timidus]|uniref:WecB/TagA/CpsF family glycosyltransferase n=1 Tax=Calidithermus timidus TaxID=307124 RepID=UPI0004782525|nr:WecB/TagA/CpsF family glycosyltransferase [Calidithermus timidus]